MPREARRRRASRSGRRAPYSSQNSLLFKGRLRNAAFVRPTNTRILIHSFIHTLVHTAPKFRRSVRCDSLRPSAVDRRFCARWSVSPPGASPSRVPGQPMQLTPSCRRARSASCGQNLLTLLRSLVTKHLRRNRTSSARKRSSSALRHPYCPAHSRGARPCSLGSFGESHALVQG
jgi:hypothetical protein